MYDIILTMKTAIHPQFFTEVVVTCACGNSFTTGSIKQTIHTEVCYKCHPLYTGEKRFVDTLGQVGKFQKKQERAAEFKASTAGKKAKKQEKQGDGKSLRELLLEV